MTALSWPQQRWLWEKQKLSEHNKLILFISSNQYPWRRKAPPRDWKVQPNRKKWSTAMGYVTYWGYYVNSNIDCVPEVVTCCWGTEERCLFCLRTCCSLSLNWMNACMHEWINYWMDFSFIYYKGSEFSDTIRPRKLCSCNCSEVSFIHPCLSLPVSLFFF